MARAILIKGGGGGITSEDVTIYSKDVPKGLAALTRDSLDEVISGTLETNVADEDVLEDAEYYNTNTFEKRKGTMPNYSGNSRDCLLALSEGEYIKFKVNDYGYYGEESSVRAYMHDVAAAGGLIASKMLGGQSAFGIEGTALSDATIDSSAQMLDGYVGYGKDGNRIVGSIPSLAGSTITPSNVMQTISCKNKHMTGDIIVSAIAGLDASKILKGVTIGGVTGTLAVTSAISFSAAAQSTSVIRISWKNPSKGPWSGVKIRMSTSGNPGLSGGTLKYTGTGSSTTAGGTSYVDITGLSVATKYYFTCYSYATGLGDSTTAYNVNATTKGLLIYNYQSAATASSYIDLYDSNASFGSNCINYDPGYILTYTGTVDLSKYTKFCIYTKASYMEKSYIRFKFEVGDEVIASDSAHYNYIEEEYYTAELPISSTHKGSWGIRISCTSSSSGGTTGDCDGQIYKMWFE